MTIIYPTAITRDSFYNGSSMLQIELPTEVRECHKNITQLKNTLAFVINEFLKVVNGNASVGYRSSCIMIAQGHNLKY